MKRAHQGPDAEEDAEEGALLLMELPSEMRGEILGHLGSADLRNMIVSSKALVVACTVMGMARQEKAIARLERAIASWDGRRPLVRQEELKRYINETVPFSWPWYVHHYDTKMVNRGQPNDPLRVFIMAVDTMSDHDVLVATTTEMWPLVNQLVKKHGANYVMALVLFLAAAPTHKTSLHGQKALLYSLFVTLVCQYIYKVSEPTTPAIWSHFAGNNDSPLRVWVLFSKFWLHEGELLQVIQKWMSQSAANTFLVTGSVADHSYAVIFSQIRRHFEHRGVLNDPQLPAYYDAIHAKLRVMPAFIIDPMFPKIPAQIQNLSDD